MTTREREITLRQRVVRLNEKRVLIARLTDTKESTDPYTLINCNGFGRQRLYSTFNMQWGVESQLRAAHAKSFLAPGYPSGAPARTQVFQLAGCAWRCWYCYVDATRLTGNPDIGEFFSCEELLNLYGREADPPSVIDLSGGQPDLVPEWPLWMMDALETHGLRGRILLRSEDNLSNLFLWEFLDDEQLSRLSTYPQYVRIGCLKGFDSESFTHNTGAGPEGFNMQFLVIEELIRSGIDLFLHATWTGPDSAKVEKGIESTMDRLYAIHPTLPLRVVPLRIRSSPAMLGRKLPTQDTNTVEHSAYLAWEAQLELRFDRKAINRAVGDIVLRGGNLRNPLI